MQCRLFSAHGMWLQWMAPHFGGRRLEGRPSMAKPVPGGPLTTTVPGLVHYAHHSGEAGTPPRSSRATGQTYRAAELCAWRPGPVCLIGPSSGRLKD